MTLKPAPVTYSNLATLYFYLHKYGEAVESYEKAVALGSEDQFIIGNLASGYWFAGDHAKALKAYDQAIVLASKELQVNPRDANVMGNLAIYYAEKGDIKNGQTLIKRAREIADSVDLTYYDAEIQYLAGHKTEAARALKEALNKGYSLDIAKADPWLGNAFQEPEFQAIVNAPPTPPTPPSK